MDCVFCKIAAKEIPTEFLYQDDEIVAFHDINPAAPTHLLIVPRRHIESLAHLTEEDTPLVAQMIGVANRLAKEGNIAQSGYRLVINSGREGGQVVPHLHLHLLFGSPFGQPIG